MSLNISFSQVDTFDVNDCKINEVSSSRISNTTPCQKNTPINKCDIYSLDLEDSEKTTCVKITDLFFKIPRLFANKMISNIQFIPCRFCLNVNKNTPIPQFEVLRT